MSSKKKKLQRNELFGLAKGALPVGAKSSQARQDEKQRRREHEVKEISEIETEIQKQAPPKQIGLLAEQFGAAAQAASSDSKTKFFELPLSEKTKQALRSAKFHKLTPIQRAAIPHALAGRDVLAAAKTGSGKTLAFLVPVIELMYRLRWGPNDGVGAIIIAPLRELALQIFEVLAQIGCNHSFSAGLLIGGKKIELEADRAGRMSVLVCTPGRLLQHMNETPNFDCSNLRVLVLDEADRCLEEGFANELNAIIGNLPRERQTLLFSATQTKRVADLARLSLRDPQYVKAQEAEIAAPDRLTQYCIVTELDKKLDVLWSFVRTHANKKMLVFCTTRQQVRHAAAVFSKLHVGLSVLSLVGRSAQKTRMQAYVDFSNKRNGALLFTTDVASRGLDFPAVDWVVQLDAPTDGVATYVHRVGRTARMDRAGSSLLLLLPSERALLPQLAAVGMKITESAANPTQSLSIRSQTEALLAEDPALKYVAQKAFISYLRAIHLAGDKTVFDVHALPAADYALSLGLVGQPVIKFKKKSSSSKSGGKRNAASGHDEEHDELDRLYREKELADAAAAAAAAGNAPTAASTTVVPTERRKKLKILMAHDERVSQSAQIALRENATVLSDAYRALHARDSDESSEEMVLQKKSGPATHESLAPLSDKERRRMARKAALHEEIEVERVQALLDGGKFDYSSDSGDDSSSESASDDNDDNDAPQTAPEALLDVQARNRELVAQLQKADVVDRVVEKKRRREKRRAKEARRKKRIVGKSMQDDDDDDENDDDNGDDNDASDRDGSASDDDGRSDNGHDDDDNDDDDDDDDDDENSGSSADDKDRLLKAKPRVKRARVVDEQDLEAMALKILNK